MNPVRLETGRARSGFSLIEALVALAIASMTLMAIFELQIQMSRGQERATRAIEQVAVQENALALIKSINFTEQPEGRLEIPQGDIVSWTTQALTEPRQNVGYLQGQGMFEVRLYRVTIDIERRQGRSPAPLVIERMGWKRLEADLIS